MSIPRPDRYVVYGSQLSYFTKKHEAALQFYGADFELRPKTAGVREEIEARAGTHQVPVMHTPEHWMLADTTPMMLVLDCRFPRRRLFPSAALGALVRVVEEWFDEWIPRTAVHYRWQYASSAAWAAPRIAEEMLPEGDAAARDGLAQMIAGWGPRACRATGVSGEAQQKAAEAEYGRILEALEAQLGETAFALGDRPCAVDAVLLGGLRAHFLADPAPKAVVEKHERVVKWAESATTWNGTGELRPFPSSTPFARFVVEEMRGAYRAFALGNARARAEGEKAFTAQAFGEDVSYLSREYPERSRQMVRARIQALGPSERAEVAQWLDDVELADVFGA